MPAALGDPFSIFMDTILGYMMKCPSLLRTVTHLNGHSWKATDCKTQGHPSLAISFLLSFDETRCVSLSLGDKDT